MTNWIITSSVLILIFVAARRLLKGHISPLLQYGLWLIVLARLIIPVNSIQSPISILNAIPAAPAAVVSETSDTTETIENTETTSVLPAAVTTTPYTEVVISDAPENTTSLPAQSSLPSLSFVLGTLWLTGMTGILIYAAIRNARLARFLHRTRRPFADGVYVAPALPSSCLFGVIRPTVYITEAVAADPQALQHVLAHEQAHRRHGDHIWNLLRIGTLALHWYNPLVWWACALSKRDAEMAADTSAIATLAPEERFSYGETLLNMLDCAAARDTWFSCSTTMITTKRALRERIEAIVKNAHTALSMAALVLLMAIAVIGCTFTGAEEEALTSVKSPTPYGDHDIVENVVGWVSDQYQMDYEDSSTTLAQWLLDSDIDTSIIQDYYLVEFADNTMLGLISYQNTDDTDLQQIDQLLSETAASLKLQLRALHSYNSVIFSFDYTAGNKYLFHLPYNLGTAHLLSDYDREAIVLKIWIDEGRHIDPKYADPLLQFYDVDLTSREINEYYVQWINEDFGLTAEDQTDLLISWLSESGEVDMNAISDLSLTQLSDGSMLGSLTYELSVPSSTRQTAITALLEKTESLGYIDFSSTRNFDMQFHIYPDADIVYPLKYYPYLLKAVFKARDFGDYNP